MSKLRIIDVGGGNGDVLKNIGGDLNISKRNLFCLESNKTGWEYVITNADNITYIFWDNINIPNTISSNSIDVVIIMVTLHHMNLSERNALFDNLNVLTKPGSLLILKEHDSQDTSDKFCIEWEHSIYAVITNPIATTNRDIKEIRKAYYEDYKSKKYWDTYICSYGYTSGYSGVFPCAPNKTYKNPTNLYWMVYVKE